MEYISIPWGNHRPDRSKNYNEWTVSLALWFVHVLAGDEHEVEWAYTSSKLDGKVSSTNTHVEATAQADEETKETEDDDTNESITTDDSEKTQEFENSSSQKRKRDPDDEDNDAIHGSFARRSFTSSYRD
jgi:myo-inositol-1-phosphate synthase